LRPRREGSPLGGTDVCCFDGVSDQNARPQILANQCQQPLVAHLAAHASHQDVVLNRVEEFRQVQIDGDAVAVPGMGLYPPQCSVGGAPRSEAEARIREPWIEQRPQDLRDGLLDDAVHYRWDAEQALATVGLGDRHPPHRLRPIRALAQGLADLRPVQTCALGKVLDAHPVNAGSTLVGLHPLPCPAYVLTRQDPLHQIVVQGWLRDLTPHHVSPRRAQRRGRAIHGSALTSHVRPFASRPFHDRAATMASADFCPVTPDVAARRAARIAVGSGGDSSAFALALRPVPLATTAPVGFDGVSSPFGLGLSSTPVGARAARETDLPG